MTCHLNYFKIHWKAEARSSDSWWWVRMRHVRPPGTPRQGDVPPAAGGTKEVLV